MRHDPRKSAWIVALGSAFGLVSPVEAQTSYPMVTSVLPTAVQRGRTSEVGIVGTQNFAGASALLFEGEGLSAEVLDASAPSDRPMRKRDRGGGSGSVRAKVTVAADAALGPRELRVVTPQGVSSIGMIVVVADPVIAEADDKANDVPASAPVVSLPCAITGAIGKVEDVDWYAFRVEAGQRLTFGVWANRLEDKIHDLQTHLDPILQLFDADGRELAADDNRHFADPFLTHEFKGAGTYFIQVRDTTYAGNPNWTYVLHATDGPVATSAFPMAVRPGATAELKAEGPNIDPAETIRLDVSADAKPGPILLPLPTSKGLSPPLPLVVTTKPIAAEEGDAGEVVEKAQAMTIPVALSGRLAEANDVDGFRFEAKKGTAYRIEVLARRVGSMADPVLRVADDKGKSLVEADDTFGKDPKLEWTAPADGPYYVQVLDLHSRGGPGFGYVIEADEAKPDFVSSCDPDKFNIGPGARTSVYVKVERQSGFKGAVSMRWDGLPSGVSASPLTLGPDMTQGVIVLSASADAKPAAGLVRLEGESEGMARAVAPRQEIYLPGGGRGLFNVSTLALAVTEPSDITLDSSATTLTIKPGQTATIDVTVKRRDGFEGPVNLAVNLAHLGQVYASPLPPGVGFKEAGSKTLLGPKETSGKIVLEAKPDAPACDGVPIAVMGHVSINFVVKTAYCTAPIMVQVKP